MESKGSTAGSQAPTAEEEEEETTADPAAKGKAKEDDPQLRQPGPQKFEQFVKGQPKDYKGRKNWFAVYSFEGSNCQWKWNEESKFWYWYAGEGKGWKKGSKDPKEKEKCEAQAKQLADYLEYTKGQGKNQGKSQAKGSRGSEEPEVVVVDDGDEEEVASFQ